MKTTVSQFRTLAVGVLAAAFWFAALAIGTVSLGIWLLAVSALFVVIRGVMFVRGFLGRRGGTPRASAPSMRVEGGRADAGGPAAHPVYVVHEAARR